MAGTVIGKPTECDIERRRGDTKDIRIRLKNKTTGAILDVTGYTGKLSINPEKEPVDALGQVFQAPGVPTGTPTDGILVFDFALFDPVAIGNYFYDVEVTDASSDIETPLIGKFTVKQDITKP